MSVSYQDYYKTLGVERGASQEEIQKSFRKLARKCHPDVSKDKGTEEKFKTLNEAYEVLKDPEKRKLYDSLGANWKAGQDFKPPPGWEHFFTGGSAGQHHGQGGGGRGAGPGGMRFEFGGGGAGGAMGGFSDFFESIFGGGGRGFSFAGSPGMEDMFGGQAQHARSGGGRSRPAQALTAELTVSLEDVYHGATKQLSLNIVEQNPDGSTSAKPRSISVKVPPGTIEGSSIRLAEGTTGKGKGGGDLLLKVHIAPHPRFVVSEFDLTTTVQITPWEAALGAKIEVPTIDGSVMLTIPAGSQSGKKFRLKDKGLPKRPSGRGDLFIKAHIAVPTELSKDEHELFEKLGKVSSFNPRH